MDSRQLLRDSIRAVLSKDEFPFEDSTRIMEDIGLDSTSALEVLMEIEDHSSLEVNPNELCIEDFRTVGTFTEFLDRSISVQSNQ